MTPRSASGSSSTARSRRTCGSSPGCYRLRLLNASLFSAYDFSLSDGRPFVQVGTGNGLLPHSVVRQDLLLGPAQRADVVVDFRGRRGEDVLLSTIPRSDGSHGTGSRSAAIMQFRVRGHAHQTRAGARPPAAVPDARRADQGRHDLDVRPDRPRRPRLVLVDQRPDVRPGAGRPPGADGHGRALATAQHQRHDPLRPPPRGAVADHQPQRRATTALGTRASRTPGVSTPGRRSRSPPGSPTIRASSWCTATCSTTRTTG